MPGTVQSLPFEIIVGKDPDELPVLIEVFSDYLSPHINLGDRTAGGGKGSVVDCEGGIADRNDL